MTNYWWQKKAEYDALNREWLATKDSNDKKQLLEKMNSLLNELSNPNLETV